MSKIHQLLLKARIATTGFSGHSIRKGAAVTAASHGISKEDIKLMGRWKSDAVQVYIDEVGAAQHKTKLLALNTRLQTQLPSQARHLLAPAVSSSRFSRR
jgi:hypothetical protein